VLAVSQIADDLAGDDVVERFDQTADVDLIADRDGTCVDVAAGLVTNLRDVELKLIG
jgi:hypothetical protein